MKKLQEFILAVFLITFLFIFSTGQIFAQQGKHSCLYENLTGQCYADTNDCTSIGTTVLSPDPCAAFSGSPSLCTSQSFLCVDWHNCTYENITGQCYAINYSTNCINGAKLASPDPCLQYSHNPTLCKDNATTFKCDSGACEVGENCCRCTLAITSCSQLVYNNTCPVNYVPKCNTSVPAWDCGLLSPKSCTCTYVPPPPTNTPKPTSTPNPGTCSCNLGYYTCLGVNSNSCLSGNIPSCKWVSDPGTPGYCLCYCVTPTPPFSDECAILCEGQGKTSACSFTKPSDDCTDSGTTCDTGAVGTNPTCWCCGGSPVQQQCGDYCNNPSRSIANCLNSQPDQSICERPSDEDGVGLDDDGSIDCNINNILYDCWCCDRIITNITPKPTMSVSGACGAGFIDTAIGCLPVGDKNAFLGFILRWAIGISGGVSFILIIYSGFSIMTAAGDKRKLQGGKELLTAALSGLILIIFAVYILDLIGLRILKIPGL